ncbi:MAG: hypothetical protein STSR0008_22770 [Ignavibacterium sp.]
MEWNDIWKIVLSVITSRGGIGVIIIATSKYIAGIFANRYIEKVKKEFEKEVEEHKTQLDIRNSATLRYSDNQFENYSKLWSSLFELKLSADKLWEQAINRNLGPFANQLKITKTEIEKAGIFI